MEFVKCCFAFFLTVISFLYSETVPLSDSQIRKEFQSLRNEVYLLRDDITSYFNRTKQLNISVVEGSGVFISGTETSCPPMANHESQGEIVTGNAKCKSVLEKYHSLIKAFGTEKKLNQMLLNRLRSLEDMISTSKTETDERVRELQSRLRTMEKSTEDNVSDIYHGIRINITLSSTGSEKVPIERDSDLHDRLESMEGSIEKTISEIYRDLRNNITLFNTASKQAADKRDLELNGRLRSIENTISNIYRAAGNNVTLTTTVKEKLANGKDLDLQNRLRAIETSIEGKISDIVQDLRNNITIFMSTVNDKIDELFIKAVQTSLKPNITNCRTVPESGVYTLYPESIMSPYTVYCDKNTNGGGWIVIMRREDGSVNFTRSWSDYKLGFGSPNGEFWAGNELLHQLTLTKPMQLRIDMEDYDGNIIFAMYEEFRVGTEADKYRLHVQGYSGTAGDSLIDTVELHHRHQGMQFTTFDSDNDKYSGNCAEFYKGGWWYNYCFVANLNGLYSRDKRIKGNEGIIWYPWTGSYEALKRVEMKIR